MDYDNKELPELLSMKYVTQRLQVHPNTLRQWVKKGYVRCFRVGARGDRRFLKEDIMEKMVRKDYLQAMRVEQSSWREDKRAEIARRGNEPIW